MNYRCSSDILNNAFDFFERTAYILGQKQNWLNKYYFSESELKTALLSITTSVELILKAKIASYDWRMIFQNPNNADMAKLLSGDFKSVSFDKCIERVEQLSDSKLTANLKTKIEQIRKARNQITHFHFKTSQESFLILASKGIDVFIEFYRFYIKEDFCEEKDRTLELEKLLFEIKEYTQTRAETITPKLLHFTRPKTYYFSECRNCYQDMLVIKDLKTIRCLFCEIEYDIEDEAKFHSDFDEITKACTTCNSNSMIALHKNALEEEAWDCIICGNFINRARKWQTGNKVVNNSIREDL